MPPPSQSRALSSLPYPPTHPPTHTNQTQETNEYILFPREAPGLDYKLNWSLAADDITPAGKAWRNADAGLLKGGKAPGGGDAKVLEAGDSVPFETFDAHLADVKSNLVRQPTHPPTHHTHVPTHLPVCKPLPHRPVHKPLLPSHKLKTHPPTSSPNRNAATSSLKTAPAKAPLPLVCG